MSVNLVDSLNLNFLDCRAKKRTHFINNHEQKLRDFVGILKLLPAVLEGVKITRALRRKNFFLAW